MASEKTIDGYADALTDWRGAELDDPDGALIGEGDRMKHVTLRSLADLDRERLMTWVSEAVRLNRDKGNPTARGG